MRSLFGLMRKEESVVQAPAPTVADPSPYAHSHISIERRFVQDGFVVVQNVFDPGFIRRLRAAAIDHLPRQAPPYKPQFSNKALFEPPFWPIFQHEAFVSVIRRLLGDDFVFLNEFALHDSFFSGWHTDTSSAEAKGGHDFHWSPSFCVLNAAIYLQDNDAIGGGLDIVPRSHLRDDPVAIALREQNGFPPDYRVHYRGTDPYADAYTIPAKAGDLVVFNLRASHRSSSAVREAKNDMERKLALFLLAGSNNGATAQYLAWKNQYDMMNNSAAAVIPKAFQEFLADKQLRILG